MPLEGKFLLIISSISYCKDNIKCDSASNAHKCSLNNGVSIAQKLVVKLSNTSTAFSKQVEITAIFQLYHGEYMLIFNEMMMRSALY